MLPGHAANDAAVERRLHQPGTLSGRKPSQTNRMNYDGLFQIWHDRTFVGLADILIAWESVSTTNFNLVVDLESRKLVARDNPAERKTV
jgi:hypothetical protein